MNWNDALISEYPNNPTVRGRECLLNERFQTLPPAPGSVVLRSTKTPIQSNHTVFEKVAWQPSLKHLYTGVPNWYPVRDIIRPVDTLYGHDYSQYHRFGTGEGKRISYQYKPYPLTNINIRDVQRFSQDLAPYPDLFSKVKYSVVTDTSLNNPMQYFPLPFYAQN